ncbi:Protein CBG27605 [Caenorhabditis briggsae]|uniref:Uncharacterized protein n=2 Tax=Caenorhabditis briggsae TaxID=6238 RepID=A0AAE9CTW9_CAEBR|nr:Protein CBG27605 [Caenorhabditis briggsae]ULT81432.1 hypothetical protein L3Y34_011380 [Caenorhabditis briggsae]CAS00405.1 Protein CBG27605 [Caenorhabditis briggsae]
MRGTPSFLLFRPPDRWLDNASPKDIGRHIPEGYWQAPIWRFYHHSKKYSWFLKWPGGSSSGYMQQAAAAPTADAFGQCIHLNILGMTLLFCRLAVLLAFLLTTMGAPSALGNSTSGPVDLLLNVPENSAGTLENTHDAAFSSAIEQVYNMSISNMLMILACIILLDILLILLAVIPLLCYFGLQYKCEGHGERKVTLRRKMETHQLPLTA